MDEQQQPQQEQTEERKTFHIPESETSDKKNMLILFLLTFGIAIFFITIFLKGISPKTDIDIGEDSVATVQDEDDNNIRAQIDQRLRMIKNDEDLPGVSGNGEYESPQDVVKRLKAMNEDAKTTDDKFIEEKKENIMEPVNLQTTQAPAPAPVKMTKIYVGQFSDMQSAVDTQSEIMSAGLGVSPVIKEVNGYYTVQVGAFSDYETARKLALKLQEAGFYANLR